MTVDALARGELHDPPLRPLPERAAELLRELAAPPRLVAHLRAVHDVSVRLAAAAGRARWGRYMELDDLLVAIGEAAEERLAFQAAHPVA
ncbi:hypothetical protein ACFY7C_03210 [Streptomyces sp. NPDC012769]|uniref:hypothetical protein n=1 Tax=Streptomyces sp. NPDC012769 TaxID=3364848 RepID=UPI00367B45A8